MRELAIALLAAQVGVLLALEVNVRPRVQDQGKDSAPDVPEWLKANGAIIHEGLHVNSTHHGGFDVRGMVSSADLVPSTVLLHIPRKLWFTLEKFPAIRDADLSSVRTCKSASMVQSLDQLRMAMAVAAESKKGSASFWAPFLRSLPTQSDFSSFYPRLIEQPLIDEFAALPIVSMVTSVQALDDLARRCFEDWRLSPGGQSTFGSIAWEDVKLGLAQVRTRSFGVAAHEAVMIPFADLFNTDAHRSLNTDWRRDTTASEFNIRVTSKLPSGTEILDSYCDTCDNDNLMTNWGVYLEDNPNRLKFEQDVDCNATIGEGSRTLRQVTEAALSQAGDRGVFTAPRCKKSTVASSRQGPLRCSLSRLAWEYCASQWGYKEGSHAALISQNARRLPSFRGIRDRS